MTTGYDTTDCNGNTIHFCNTPNCAYARMIGAQQIMTEINTTPTVPRIELDIAQLLHGDTMAIISDWEANTPGADLEELPTTLNIAELAYAIRSESPTDLATAWIDQHGSIEEDDPRDDDPLPEPYDDTPDLGGWRPRYPNNDPIVRPIN